MANGDEKANPYEPPLEHNTTTDPRWRAKLVAVALLTISVVLTACLILGSFVTFAKHPRNTTVIIQNFYIDRIMWFGIAIGVLQIAAIATLLRGKS